MLLSRGGLSSALRREHGWPRPVAALPRPAVKRGPRVLRPLALASASRVESSGVESTGDSAHDGPHAVNGPSQLGPPADHPETPAPPGLDDGTGDTPSSADGGSAPGSGSGSGSGGGGRSGGRVALRGFGGGGDRGPRRGPVGTDPSSTVAVTVSVALASTVIVYVPIFAMFAGLASIAVACAGAGAAVMAMVAAVVVFPIALFGAMFAGLADAIVTGSLVSGAMALAYKGAEMAIDWWEELRRGGGRGPGLGRGESGSAGRGPAGSGAAAAEAGATAGGVRRGEEAGEAQGEDWAREAWRVGLQAAAALAAAAGVFAVRALAHADSAASVFDEVCGTAQSSYGSSRRRSTFGGALSDPGDSTAPSTAAATS
ncbi:hypothetical protein HYH03_018273 [Edaphochlamys debaryana]|uniref:Uncharacterized protein n=1 Tax=Edaphochlamys debaryana TaxID=47281 RepID=A0A835XFM7_9CHLO|nr:hypothetical protein HYH03_018273 [Edaphochlamys debaryana]|eukprot:KAG2482836.1 hypothetical protein HYH03_018273 [Edaphochlamys debaryana]